MQTNINKTSFTKIGLLGIFICLNVYIANGQNLNSPNKTGPMGLQVNTQTGNLFFSRTDVVIPSRGFGLAINFNYNGFNFAQAGPFGNGWSLGYNIQYLNDAENNKTIIWGDGREDIYKNNGIGYTHPTGFFSRLQEYEPNKLLLSEKDGTKFYFENATHKRITKITEPNGNLLNFSYTDTLLTGISTSAGQKLTLAYNANGRLSTLTDANATPTRSWSYFYDNAGNLIRVTDPLNNEYRYSYLVNGPVKEVHDRNANVVNIIYFSNYAVSELIGCNQRISFAYDDASLATVVTDHMDNGEDQVTKYFYKKNEDNVWLSGMEGNCCGFKMSFEYDHAGNKIKETDANGNITRYTYDENGNMLTVTDALNQVYNFTYTSDFHFVKTTTDPKGFTSEMTYDNRGNLIQIKEPGNRIYSATYAANGDILTSTDPKGNVYTYTYDVHGNPATVDGPNGYAATFAFDGRGQLLSTTDSKGNQTSVEYDILSRLKKITDPLNQNMSMQYDANGNALQVTNPNNESFKFSYDASNRPVVLTDPLNQNIILQYDAQSNLILMRNILNQTVKLNYDKQNRLKAITNNIGEALQVDYDRNGNVTQINFTNGRQLQYAYDVLDRMISMWDEHGMIGEFTYDANNNTTSIKNANGAITTATYDSLNRMKTLTDPLGSISQFTYDINNRIVSKTDNNGNTTEYAYDSRNRITTVTDPLGGEIRVGYDTESNVTSLTDQNGNITSYQYDALNRLTRTTYADGRFMELSYNNKNLIIKARLTNGSFIEYGYDALNRMTSKTLPDGRVYTYTYDGHGRVSTATNQTGIVKFTYDNLNRVASETFNGRTIMFEYDNPGRKITTIYPDKTQILKEYDSRNRLIRVLENGIELANYTYNNNNRLLTRNFSNGISTQYQYDVANRLNGYSSGNGKIQHVQIAYDKMGNKTSIIRANNFAQNEYFTYDNNYRLTQYQRGPQGSPNLLHTYSYDALGNRLSANIGGTITTYNVNNLNQLIQKNTDGSITNLLYDDNGNLQYDGKFFKSYDADKKLLVDSLSPSEKYTYQYDAMGRRISKNNNGQIYNFTYAGMNAIEEMEGNKLRTKQIFTRFALPLTIDYNNQKHFYFQNELGSVEAITNSYGRLIERYEYDPYGKQIRLDSLGQHISTSLVGNRFGFTGQVYDSATEGNSFFFRNYNPELGIFQQRDLIGYSDGMGLYQYVHNNPANGIDIWGLNDCDPNDRINLSTPVSWASGGNTIINNRVEKFDPSKADEVTNLRRRADWAYGKAETNLRPSDLEFIEKGIPPVKTEYGDFSDIVHEGRIKRSNEYLKEAAGSKIKAKQVENSLNQAKNAKLNNLNKLGKGLNLVDNAVKGEAMASAWADGPSDGYNTQEWQATADFGVSLISWHPVIGTVYGLSDLAVETITGKGITSHTADFGQWAGQKSVDLLNNNESENDLWEQAVAQGKTRQYIQARAKMNRKQRGNSNCPQNGNNGGTRRPSPYPRDPQSGEILILGAYDPNEIIGPAGQPDKRWVSVNDRMPYTINFENDTIASAPAKSIRITAPIHPNMDANTLELGSFGFNSLSFSIPAGTSAYYQRLDCRDSLSIFVDITAGFDVVNNQVFWLLQSIDPLTLQPPTDPMIGLLLLQDTAKPTYGHGFVNFSIKPRTSAATLDTIAALADIIFDNNEVIPTNVEVNTIDAVAPTSQLAALPPTSPTNIVLNWSGNDDAKGSGLHFYTLYVSEDGINFNIVRTNITRTDTVITGQVGQHYYFFVLATDSVGNTEKLRQGAIQNTFVGAPLPATWLSFTGINQGSDNLLRWATANERNVKEFVLERSNDANTFKSINKQKPNGGAVGQGHYQYLDERVDRLKTDALYYRVKQVDSDGSYNYSSTIKIAIRQELLTHTVVYPNPTRNLLTIAVGSPDLIGTQATIIDGRGRTIQQIIISSNNHMLNLDKQPAGMYYIKLKNGEVLKVIKQ